MVKRCDLCNVCVFPLRLSVLMTGFEKNNGFLVVKEGFISPEGFPDSLPWPSRLDRPSQRLYIQSDRRQIAAAAQWEQAYQEQSGLH